MTSFFEEVDNQGESSAPYSSSSSSVRIASGADHPLQKSAQEGEGVAAEMVQGQAEEGSRLLGSADSRRTQAARPHTFAGRSRSDMFGDPHQQQHDERREDRKTDTFRGAAEHRAGGSSSWGHFDQRGRSFALDTASASPRAGSIPSRLPVMRTVSMSGMPSLGTGYEGHPASRLRMDGEDGVQTWRAGAIGSTPLERTIDAIGMGRYQYAVLVLSGFGWAADNMWLQGVAIILPRVQDEWQIGDQWIGLVSSCTFAGMMVGALAWGSYSDAFGRKNAFNGTLLVTSIFGLLSSFAPNFPLLCLCLFLLGTGVGGSMPTDGTIFLEALPKRNHYLLTALSVFFAAGSVVSSLLGLLLVPHSSCGGARICDPAQNKGWRRLLISLGICTLIFLVARIVFFSLFESPKFLVSAGRHEEARSVLQRIAAFNGDPKKFRLSDVHDQEDGGDEQRTQDRPGLRKTLSQWNPVSWMGKRNISSMDGQENGEESQRLILDDDQDGGQVATDTDYNSPIARLSSRWKYMPASWAPSLDEARKRYEELFSPHWLKTTVLIWSIWTIFTLAYTMVNIFLPKYLQDRSGTTQSVQDDEDLDAATRQKRIEAVMQEFLFYSLASLPGSLMGAYLIETPLGRIKSMALSTGLLSLALLSFAFAVSPMAVIVSSCAVSLFAAISYAVIYSYSPEVFETSVRGTANGTASALSRLAGIIAPLLAGVLMRIEPSLPLLLGFALLAVTVWLQLSLPYETRRSPESEQQQDAP